MSKPLVIYHADCADGFGAAFAAWTKLGDAAEYVPMKYVQHLPSTVVVWKRDVYILDFSFPRIVMDGIFKLANRVVWLDHHKTAFEMWCGGVPDDGFYGFHRADPRVGTPCFIKLDNDKSGAMLAWEYFHPTEDVPLLIQHIDDHDRWQLKLIGTKAFNKALWSYAPWNFSQWASMFMSKWSRQSDLLEFDQARVIELCNEGEAILRAHEQHVRSMVENAVMECDVGVGLCERANPYGGTELFQGLAANCPPHLSSDVGHELATRSGTFGLCWSMEGSKLVKCSLRSNGDYDVSAIAKTFGGGGHLNAASFHTDIETLMGWLR